MPFVDNEVKLDFKDVLIRPKRSFLSSRSQVSLDRTFTFPNSKQTWTGVPIVAASIVLVLGVCLPCSRECRNMG